jgi:hypothetical protein
MELFIVLLLNAGLNCHSGPDHRGCARWRIVEGNLANSRWIKPRHRCNWMLHEVRRRRRILPALPRGLYGNEHGSLAGRSRQVHVPIQVMEANSALVTDPVAVLVVLLAVLAAIFWFGETQPGKRLFGIVRLGPKPLLMMLAGTAGVMIGGPIASWIFSPWVPPDTWQGSSSASTD